MTTGQRPTLVPATGEKKKWLKVADVINDEQLVVSRLAAVKTRYLQPERLIRIATQAVRKTPLLAQCEPYSFVGSLMSASLLGLEPNTPEGLSWLIPYKNRRQIGGEWKDVYECQFQIGYRGWLNLMYRQPAIKAVDAECIHEHDTFEHAKGSEMFLKFQKNLFGRGNPIGSYCFVKLDDGISFTVLPLEEIEKIMSRSETYRNLKARASANDHKTNDIRKFEETPWVLWFDDMAAKSAIKKHAKMLRLSPDMALASEIDGDDDTRRFDLSSIADPDAARAAASGEIVVTGMPMDDEQDDQRQGQPQLTSVSSTVVNQVRTDAGGQAEPAQPRRQSQRKTSSTPNQAAAEGQQHAPSDEHEQQPFGDDDGEPDNGGAKTPAEQQARSPDLF